MYRSREFVVGALTEKNRVLMFIIVLGAIDANRCYFVCRVFIFAEIHESLKSGINCPGGITQKWQLALHEENESPRH